MLGLLRTFGRLSLLAAALSVAAPVRALPPGFTEENVGGTWNEVAGLTFDARGRMYVWERAGRVWIVEDGVKRATPLIDLHDEVGGWDDLGLLGFALHPNFSQNGYIYLLYVVDRYNLLHAGSPSYDPNANQYHDATIGRLVRYTANAADGFNSVDPASRLVLVGATKTDGCPILFTSHGTGSLVFADDGTLFAACGDGASFDSVDAGSASETYYQQALSDGIISPKENVGAFRAQLVDSLSGKIWRIDPMTGAGVPSNPFYNAANPYSKASRVWALGVRNPYRMTLRPETGSHDPADGDPGTLYVGDVGWDTWEDLHVVKQGGQNLGWPLFEGMQPTIGYPDVSTQNLDAPNPLYNGTTCTQPYFYFQNLIAQQTQPPNPNLPNPCGGTITTAQTFVHSAPEVDWHHGAAGPARSKVFTGGVLTPVTIGAPGSPVVGSSFGGNASTGGVWYTGTDFPAQYQNTYFHADYGAGWIRNFSFDANDQPTRVDLFQDSADGVVFVTTHPTEGGLYYVSWTSAVRRVRWVGIGNQPPKAVASADVLFGATPLTVHFTGGASSDPEGFPLKYLWRFGDGTTSNYVNPVHTFTAAPGVPTAFDASLTVTDATLQTSVASLRIWVNDTPPSVQITSPVDGTRYPLSGTTVYPLQANISDAEQGSGQLTCAWETLLHHNNHVHTEPVDTNCSSSTTISPVGCDGNVYYYIVSLTVTDPLGLSTTASVNLLPDCPIAYNYPPQAVIGASPRSGAPPLTVTFSSAGSSDPESVALTYAWTFGDGGTSTLANPTHTYSAAGTYIARLTVSDGVNATTSSDVTIAVGSQATGLVAQYRFEEASGTSALDGSANGNTGSLGAATRTSAGKYGSALSFNGTTAMVSVNDSPSLELTSAMTLEAWVNPTSLGSWRDVVYKGTNDNYYLEGSSDPSAFPATGGTYCSSSLKGTATLPLNAWSHLAATYDGATVRLYVNGTQVASRAQTGSIETSTGPLTLGGDPLYGQYWTGKMDEVRVYNRALGAGEIQADMMAPAVCGIAGGSLRFAEDKQTISWSDSVVSGPFDVVKGDLGLVRSSGGSFTGAACFENNVMVGMTTDPAVPAPGGATYYMMRCDGGTWGDGTQIGNRDATLPSCP